MFTFKIVCSVRVRTSFSATHVSPDCTQRPAAWRSGGWHYKWGGLLPFVFARHFQRSYCRRCAKPLVVCLPSLQYSTNVSHGRVIIRQFRLSGHPFAWFFPRFRQIVAQVFWFFVRSWACRIGLSSLELKYWWFFIERLYILYERWYILYEFYISDAKRLCKKHERWYKIYERWYKIYDFYISDAKRLYKKHERSFFFDEFLKRFPREKAFFCHVCRHRCRIWIFSNNTTKIVIVF